MLKDLLKVEDRVAYLLNKYPQCRESDKYLWLAYCVNFCEMKSNLGSYDDFKWWLLKDDVPVFESLSRARRKIMERDESKRSLNYAARKEEETAVREWARKCTLTIHSQPTPKQSKKERRRNENNRSTNT